MLFYGGREPLFINNTLEHEVASNLSITYDLNIRSYLGVPILDQEGEMFGTLCAVSDQSASFTEEDVEIIQRFSAVFSYVVEVEKQQELLRDQKRKVEHSLQEQKYLNDKIRLAYEETEKNRIIYQDIIDNVSEAIIFVNKAGELVHFNNQMGVFLDDTHSTMSLGQPFEQWSKPFLERVYNSDTLNRFFLSNMDGHSDSLKRIKYEIRGPVKKIIEVYGDSVYRNDEKIGTLFVHRDVTLAFEVDKLKSELVSTVSHELRTPLASVLGFTELLLTKELKPERQRKYIETVNKEANRLTNLINNFLDLQRMESGEQSYEMTKINIVSVVEEVVERFKTNHPDHSFVVINNTSKSVIFADPDRLIQLYTNLIGNALKFSPNGGNIIIAFEANEKNIIVKIADEGLGIPLEELPKLFRKFQRIDNSDRRRIGGTGLGLAICKEIVEKHQGQINVESELGKGTTFTIVFPLSYNV